VKGRVASHHYPEVIMKRAVWVLFLVFVALAAPAAGQVLLTDAAQPLRLTVPVFEGEGDALRAFSTPTATAGQLRSTSTSRLSRRLASMVGYLEDPIVSSKVRVRYELGFENTAPDRAEFFYGKCGCYRNPALGSLFDPDAPGPGPGAATDLDFRQIFVWGEYAASDRVSVFGELPIRWILPQAFLAGTGAPFDDQSGIGDLRAGAKFALSTNDMHTVTAQVKAFLPTGEADKGLGTDHLSIEPALLYFQQLGERAAIEAEGGLWLPYGGADGIGDGLHEHFAGRIFFFGVGPSVDVVRTDRVRIAPVVELIGWHVLGGYSAPTTDAEGTKIYNIKFGARVVLNNQGSFYFGYGKALTDDVWYDDILRFEYRHGF
jgi:hypothetical protein